MGSTFIDITGQTFNELTALKCIDTKSRTWLWKCSCGNECTARKNDVTSGKKKSCGHLSNRGGATINIGDKFGEWTVLQNIDNKHFLCRCSCGVERSVHSYDLRKGNTKSCGHVTKGTSANGRKDMTGQKIGEWTVGNYLGNGLYECTCSCGTVKNLKGTYLRTGQSKSCGCKSNKFQDITGQTFNEWTVLSFEGDYKWKCQCSCGKIGIVNKSDLVNGNSRNCGHTRTPDLKGKKFGMLNVLKYLGNNYWECQCDCGNVKKFMTNNLVNGGTKSCGCLKDLKEQQIYDSITQAIKNFAYSNNQLPFAEDIAIVCKLTPTTVNKYKSKYNLDEYFNKRFGSRPERDLYNYIRQYITDDKIKIHDRNIISPQELDIYIPEKRLALEFNGNYWHSDDKVGKNYHQQKVIACAKQGIQLIHIFEYEWNNTDTQEKLKQLIKSKLKSPDTILYARNTELKQVPDSEAEVFLNKYHLQGSAPATIKLGLYYDEELISILTLGVPRFNNNYAYEIVRYCTKNEVGVVGGIEKLYKYFIDTYKPKSVITYSNISKFTGNVYNKIGFKPVQPKAITEPGYVWINEGNDTVLQRYQTQKHKLLKSGLGTEDQTENEIMRSNGFIKVHDCGNIKLEWVEK